MRNSDTTRFKKGIRITESHYNLILKNKKKKSAAGFLEEIIELYFKPNLFNKNGYKQKK